MLFRLILWVILILAVVFFVIFNVEPRVQVHLLPGFTLENIPLALVIIVSFILGLLAGVILSLSQIIKYKMKIRKLEKMASTSVKPVSHEEKSEEKKNETSE